MHKLGKSKLKKRVKTPSSLSKFPQNPKFLFSLVTDPVHPQPPYSSPMASFFGGGRFKEFLKKYGKVAAGVHLTVSAASISGLYVAINNNVDVESILHKVGISAPASSSNPNAESPQISPVTTTDGDLSDGIVTETFKGPEFEKTEKKRNRTAEMAAGSGGALALAILCNKALFPIRVPITIALTPPIARFLRNRSIIKNL